MKLGDEDNDDEEEEKILVRVKQSKRIYEQGTYENESPLLGFYCIYFCIIIRNIFV